MIANFRDAHVTPCPQNLAQAGQTPIRRLRRAKATSSTCDEGLSSKQIMQREAPGVRTVETHRLIFKRKLEIKGQAEQIKFAVEHRRK